MEIIEEVSFVARHRDWMVVKKLLIDASTKPEEIALILASIDKTVVRKSYEYAGIKADVIEEYVNKVVKKGKSFSNLALVLSSLKPSEVKSALLSACPSAEHYPIAESYFIKKLIEAVGFEPALEPETLGEVFPHLKIPKPRGNFGSKKK